MTGISDSSAQLKIAIVAGEHSGDHLGAALMTALDDRVPGGFAFSGVGGVDMADAGLETIFPLEDVAVMGPIAIAGRLPRIVRRIYQTIDHVVRTKPDVLVIIDSPEFTHPIAKRVRKRNSDIPIINYVSPSVWAWRPGRARKMTAYIDHVLALLPFEPKAHQDLGGPACTYVGHPLSEKVDWMQTVPTDALAEQLQLRAGKPVLVVLPGSRTSEVKRLMPTFAQTLHTMNAMGADFETIIPAVPHVRHLIDAALKASGARAHVVEGADAKYQAFRLATCALAASGTVTLELALAGTPMVVAYKIEKLATTLKYVVNVPSIVLPNLILGENKIPEILQEKCLPDNLAAALLPLLARNGSYDEQLAALRDVQTRVKLPDGRKPSDAAADVVYKHALTTARRRRVFPDGKA